MINFSDIQPTLMPNFQGGEGITAAQMFVDDKNKIMRITLAPGSSIGMHCHETSCEVIYVLEGIGTAVLDGVEEKVEAGKCHYCPKGHTHSFINKGKRDLVFFAVVPQQ
jgi:mannose-6-phosphate isomerase-like protein (cupin superfamily)